MKQEEREKIEVEREEYLEGWKRAKADLINYKKGETERASGLIAFTAGQIILSLLPIVDDLERAEAGLSNEVKELEGVQGILQIKRLFAEVLEKMGAEKLEVLEEQFDPRTAEASDEIVREDIDEGIVVEVVRTGYTFNGKVIRPAQVKISKKK